MRLTNWLFAAVLCPTAAWAGGGVIVGNGAGLAEQNVIYAYTVLYASVTNCLDSPSCALRDDERAQLEKIQAVIQGNLGKKNMIRFKSEKDEPNFFELSTSEPHRIARTGLTSDEPIWFNTDELYDSSGSPVLDHLAATAILVHEVGHQSGSPDHAFLDQIGAKVRFNLEKRQQIYRYEGLAKPLSIRVVNYDSPSFQAEVFLDSEKNRTPLSPSIRPQLHCAGPNSILLGYEVWNGHWDISSNPVESKVYPFVAWVRFNCLSSNGQLLTQQATLTMSIDLESASGEARCQDLKVGLLN